MNVHTHKFCVAENSEPQDTGGTRLLYGAYTASSLKPQA